MRERSAEGVLEVVDLVAEQGGDVEADGRFVAQRGAIIARDPAVALLLLPRDRLRGQPEGVALARLDLHETDVLPPLRHDVRLAEGGLVVARYDLVSVSDEIAAGRVLSLPSQNFVTKVLR